MTDLEAMRAMFDRAGIRYEVVHFEPEHLRSNPDNISVGSIAFLPDEMSGPGGYYSEIVFTADGALSGVRVSY